MSKTTVQQRAKLIKLIDDCQCVIDLFENAADDECNRKIVNFLSVTGDAPNKEKLGVILRDTLIVVYKQYKKDAETLLLRH